MGRNEDHLESGISELRLLGLRFHFPREGELAVSQGNPNEFGSQIGFRALRLQDGFEGRLPSDLELTYRLRHDWNWVQPYPARVPPMLAYDPSDKEWRLFPGPLRPGRSEDEPKELAARELLNWRNCFPRFPVIPDNIRRGWCRRFRVDQWPLELRFRHHLAESSIPRRVREVSLLKPLAPVKVIEALGHGGQAVPASSPALSSTSPPPVSYELLTKLSAAIRRRALKALEQLPPSTKAEGEVIVVADDSPQPAASSESASAGGIRRSGRLACKHQGPAIDLEEELLPSAGRAEIVPAIEEPDEVVDALFSPTILPIVPQQLAVDNINPESLGDVYVPPKERSAATTPDLGSPL